MDGINALIARGFGPFQSFSELEDKREQQRLQNEMARMTIAQERTKMEGLPEERQWQQEGREFTRKQRGQAELKTNLDLLQEAYKFLPRVTLDQYLPLRQQFAKVMPQAANLLPESFASEEEFEGWKNQVLPQVEEGITKIKEMNQLSKQLYDLDWRQLNPEQKQKITSMAYPQTEQLSEFDKTLKQYNSLPEGDPNKQFYLARIKKMSEASGLQVRVNKDGTVEIIQGPMGGAGQGMTKPSQTEVEKKIMSAGDALQRLGEIETRFKPEYQEIGTKWNVWKTTAKEKLGKELNPAQKELVTDFSEYKRRSIHNLNLYIKDITGAQLTVQEAERLTRGMPNPGQGILDGDSPTEFKSKLSGIMTELRMAIARNNYIRKHGLKMEALSLGAMKNIINDRANEIEQELIKKGTKGKELEQEVIKQLGNEFGLTR